MAIKNDAWYQKNHEKEKKTLEAILRRIARGAFWIVSVRIDSDGMSGTRLVVFLRERK